MKKEKIIKNLILLGILCIMISVYYFDDQTNTNNIMDYRIYNGETHYIGTNMIFNETLEILPPDWLLEIYKNITVNESFGS